jgi:hypothetical protein
VNISPALAAAIKTRLHLLDADLKTAGLLSRGLTLDGTTLMTSDAGGNPAELSAAAQAFVAAYTPPAPPPVPTWGAETQTPDQMADQLATAVGNIRAYINLGAPTEAQRKAYENLLGRGLLFLLHREFPDL